MNIAKQNQHFIVNKTYWNATVYVNQAEYWLYIVSYFYYV